MAITIKQIAEYAGVSRGTVDRALNHREGINPEVAERICNIATEMGYTPNRAGKALASKKNPVQIGVILNSIGNPFYEDVIEGIRVAEQEYSDFSVEVHLKQLKGYDVERQLKEIELLEEQKVNAIAVTAINDVRVEEKIKELTQNGMIVVKLNSEVEHTGGAVYIGCDYLRSGEAAAGLMGLCAQQPTKVGVVTGSAKMLGHNQRVQGFSQVCGQNFPQIEIAYIAENNDDDDQSYQVTKQLIQEYAPQALYFAAGGVLGGIRAVDELCNQNRPIIICCDATAPVKKLLLENKISAVVCQQPFKQGYESIKTIFTRLMTGEFPFENQLYMENEIKLRYNL